MAPEKSILSGLSQQVDRLIELINGKPFDANDIGMKGALLKSVNKLEHFDVGEFKANTNYRKRKEAEMSRFWFSLALTCANVFLVAVFTYLTK